MCWLFRFLKGWENVGYEQTSWSTNKWWMLFTSVKVIRFLSQLAPSRICHISIKHLRHTIDKYSDLGSMQYLPLSTVHCQMIYYDILIRQHGVMHKTNVIAGRRRQTFHCSVYTEILCCISWRFIFSFHALSCEGKVFIALGLCHVCVFGLKVYLLILCC